MTLTFIVPAKAPHPGFFDEALRSLLAQSDPDWSALVVTESGDPVLSGWTPPDPRIRILANEAKLLSGAINTGLRRAATDFAAVLLGDDLLDAKAVEVLAARRRAHPEADFFHSSMRFIDHAGAGILKPIRAGALRGADDFLNHGVRHLMCFRVAKALSIGGVDERLGLHGADDYDFPWSMWESGARFQAVPEALYLYRVHDRHERLTTHVPLDVQVEELRKIFLKHGLPPARIERELRVRAKGYLRQALTDERSKR